MKKGVGVEGSNPIGSKPFAATRMHSSRMHTTHPLTMVPVCMLVGEWGSGGGGPCPGRGCGPCLGGGGGGSCPGEWSLPGGRCLTSDHHPLPPVTL